MPGMTWLYPMSVITGEDPLLRVIEPYDGTGSGYIEVGAGFGGERSTPTSCLG